ncbi:MAG: MFS-type efflux pump [Sphingomonadales bacterium]|nr:MFS-type efflux pump [Sphingomonadales bacterium]
MRANLMLALLVLAYICSYLDRQILSLMVGPVRASLHISDFEISLLQGFAFAIFFALAGLPLGWLADRFNRIWIIAAGVLLWGGMTIACGFANSFEALFIARMGLGIGEAALAPAGFSLLADSFEERKLVRAISIFSLGGLLGGGMAFFVGGALIDFLGSTQTTFRIGNLEAWQMAFVVISVPGLLLVPFLLLLREPPRRGVGLAASGISETIAYLWRRRRDYGPFYITAALLGIANYSGLAWFPTHLMRQYGMSPTRVGVIMGVIQLTGCILGTILGASLTGYFQRKGRLDAHLRTIMFISVLAAIGMAAPLMPTVEMALSVWILFIISSSAYFGSNIAALQLMTPNTMRAANSSLLLLILILGGLAFGTAAVGALADHVFPNSSSGIGHSLALVGISAALVSVLVAERNLRHFGEVVRNGFGLDPS